MRTVAERRDLAAQVRILHARFDLIKTLSNKEALLAFEHAVKALGMHRAGGWYLRLADGAEPTRQSFEPPGMREDSRQHVDLEFLYGEAAQIHAAMMAGKVDAYRSQEWKGADLIHVLILLLPHLEHLSLQTSHHFEFQKIPMSFLAKAGIRTLPLRTLDLALYAQSAAPLPCLLGLERQTGSILELATGLQTLNIHMCGAIRAGGRPFTSMPNLKVLRITHSRLNSKELNALISACVKLEEFHYEAAIPDHRLVYNHPPHHHFQLIQAIQCLKSQRNTLKSLHLDLRGPHCATANQNASKHLSTLTEFAVLAHLSINSNIVCNSEETEPCDTTFLARCISPTLSSLNLIGTVASSALPHLARSLLNLAQVIQARQLPAFKRIRLDAGLQLVDYGIAEVFAGAHVELSYETWPSSKATVLTGDWMPRTYFVQDIELPPDLGDDPDLG